MCVSRLVFIANLSCDMGPAELKLHITSKCLITTVVHEQFTITLLLYCYCVCSIFLFQ